MNSLLRNLLVIDIETVSVESNFDEMPSELKDHWRHKSQFLRNPDDLGESDLFFNRAGIYAEFGKVVVIGMGIFHLDENNEVCLRVKSLQNDRENDLLKEFSDFLIKNYDQDELRLCGHNGKEFDFPYLCRRFLINKVDIPGALNISGRKPWEINHVDTLELWKFGDRKNFTSLDLLTTILGISSSKSDMDGSKVNEVYYNEDGGLDRIAEYCKGDVVATAQLYLKLNNLPLVPEGQVTIV